MFSGAGKRIMVAKAELNPVKNMIYESTGIDEFDEEDGYVSSNVVASDQTKTDSSASSDLEFD